MGTATAESTLFVSGPCSLGVRPSPRPLPSRAHPSWREVVMGRAVRTAGEGLSGKPSALQFVKANITHSDRLFGRGRQGVACRALRAEDVAAVSTVMLRKEKPRLRNQLSG